MSRVVAVVQRADVDDDGVALLDARVRRAVVRQRGVRRAGGDDRLVARSAGAERRASGSPAGCAPPLPSVPAPRSGATSASAASAMRQASAIRAISPSSFVRRSASTTPSRPTSVGDIAASYGAELRVGDVGAPRSPMCRKGRTVSREQLVDRSAGGADLDRAVDAGGGHLRRRLVAVSPVGDQHQLVGQARPTQPFEPVNPVSQRMLERSLTSRASARSPSRAAHPRRPGGDLQRLHQPASFRAIASTASR